MNEVAPLLAVLVDLRRPASLERGPEDRRHPRVRRVPRHPGAVDVVVPQRDRGPAGHPGPGSGQMLLGELAGRVGVAGVQRGVLGDGGHGEGRRAPRAAGLEPGRLQIAHLPRGRPDPAVPGAVVGAFPVDHHGRGQHQAGHAAAAHGLEQHRGPGHVDVGVGGQIGQVDAEADQGGLVAHDVRARHRPADRVGVTDVPHRQLEVVRQVIGPPGVHGRGQRVQALDLVARRPHDIDCVGADETSGPGHQYSHNSSESCGPPGLIQCGSIRHSSVRVDNGLPGLLSRHEDRRHPALPERGGGAALGFVPDAGRLSPHRGRQRLDRRVRQPSRWTMGPR